MSHKTTAARRRENMTLELPQAVDYFCTSLTLEGKSPETVLWHRKKLPAFVQFLQQQGHSLKVKDLRVEDARAFIKSLLKRKTRYNAHVLRKEVEGGLAMTTVHGNARSLRTFASWLEREGYTNENIFEGLKPPKLPQILIEPLAEDEIRKILLLIPQDTSEGVRSYAIVLLFLDSGIRLSELINLRISQIDFAVGQFKVFGKGAKERIVPMGLAPRCARRCGLTGLNRRVLEFRGSQSASLVRPAKAGDRPPQSATFRETGETLRLLHQNLNIVSSDVNRL
jgi:site-specific recombinase XerD